jgi:shikimate dehydrogenase
MLTSEISGSTRLFAILADPVLTVRSPSAFNEVFSKSKKDAVFIGLHVAGEDLVRTWEGLKLIKNLDAVTFTMPHKVIALGLVDELGPVSRIVGAVNAARRRADGTWYGDTFDGLGFCNGLLNNDVVIRGQSAYLVGVGGAGGAIAAALAQAGIAKLVMHDKDTAKLENLMTRIKQEFPEVDLCLGREDRLPIGIAINATPLGMKEDDALSIDLQKIPRGAVVADVVTKPERTKLLEEAARLGFKTVSGRFMHEGQVSVLTEFFGLKSL